VTQEQISMLLRLLERIADRPFTITQATDWQMLYILLGMVASILMVSVGLFWRDVGRKFGDMKETLKEFKANDEKCHDMIWSAMRDCQADCCPRGEWNRRRTDAGGENHDR